LPARTDCLGIDRLTAPRCASNGTSDVDHCFVTAGLGGAVAREAATVVGSIPASRSFGDSIWDTERAKEIAVLRGADEPVTSAGFSPDGSRIVMTSGKTARLWDAAAGTKSPVLRGYANQVTSAAFSPDG
jgi:WD40 repeat protein